MLNNGIKLNNMYGFSLRYPMKVSRESDIDYFDVLEFKLVFQILAALHDKRTNFLFHIRTNESCSVNLHP